MPTQLKKSCFLLTVFLLVSISNSFAQYRQQNNELGFELGTAQFFGELGGRNNIGRSFITDFDLRSLREMVGGYFKMEINPKFKLNFSLRAATLSGTDKNIGASYGDKGYSRQYRNLSFKSNIQEVSVDLQYNFVEYLYKYNKKRRFYPYVYSGVGMFHQNPKAQLNGQWVALQPLGTEGQGLPEYPGRKKYSNIQGFWSVGAGLKIQPSALWSFNLGLAYRMTTTDYMDDVSKTYADPKYMTNPQAILLSNRTKEVDAEGLHNNYSFPGQQRGDPTQWDSYLFPLTFGFAYNFGGYSNYGYAKSCPSLSSLSKGVFKQKRTVRKKHGVGCPGMIN